MIANTTFDGLFGSAWIAALLLSSIIVTCNRQHKFFTLLSPMAVLVGALFVRLVPAMVLNAGLSADIQSYALIARLVRAGHDVYSGIALSHYPYLPGQLWFSALSLDIQDLLHGAVPFVVLIKLTPVLADAGTAVALMAGLRRRGYARQTAAWVGSLYALNPISILITSYHGQFHGVPVFFCTVAWWLYEERRNRVTAQPFALLGVGLALGAAILSKSWPALLAPAFLITVRRPGAWLLVGVGIIAVPVVATVAYAVVYHVPILRIVEIAVTYQSSAGAWGLGAFTAWLHGRAHLLSVSSEAVIAHVSQIVVIAGAVFLPLRHRDWPMARTILVVILCFFTASTNFNTQYLMWVVPSGLLLLVYERAVVPVMTFMIVATLALAVTYMGAGWIYHVLPSTALIRKGWQVAFYPVYLVGVYWFFQEAFIHQYGWRWLWRTAPLPGGFPEAS